MIDDVTYLVAQIMDILAFLSFFAYLAMTTLYISHLTQPKLYYGLLFPGL